MSATRPVTLLFTDLVNAAELVQRVGDEQAQRTFRAHHKLLKTAATAHGGQEVKWLGDGLMTAFSSTADALRCAVAMQQAARRRAAGERLSIRVGLNVGEAPREETDGFGILAIARGLSERAQGGQILCSALVAGLLAGRQAFTFRDCGALELTGSATSVGTYELLYQQDAPATLLAHTPFVGRTGEIGRLTQKLSDVYAGHGGLILLVGEPGIGKTRTMEEFAESARERGALVISGRCIEGEGAPAYGSFSEALTECVRSTDPEQLRTDLGLGVATLARLLPVLRETLPDIPEPAPLQPDEERLRLLDAVTQYLIAVSVRIPLVLILDDLHWADKGTIAMLRHVARFAPRQRILLLGNYRDTDVERGHPLADALAALPRETGYDHLALKGLATAEVQELLETIADQKVPEVLVQAVRAETSGNPFFIREVLLHLVEERTIFQREGRWTSDLGIAEMGIPETVRQVIGQRLARLSESANRFLDVASGFAGAFRFDIVARVAELHEMQALNAVDEAVAAQLLCTDGDPESCDFSHALVRHTLHAALSPPRQVRLHRQIAEAMEEVYGLHSTSAGRNGLAEHAAEIADHYHRSASLPGAERGAAHALVAAERAAAAAAHDEVAKLLRMALRLLDPDDSRRPRLLGKLAMAMTWSLDVEGAVPTAREAASLMNAGGEDGTAYLAEAALAMWGAGFPRGASALAAEELSAAGERRDRAWAVLKVLDIVRRDAERPDHQGVLVDSVERREVAPFIERRPEDQGEARHLGIPWSLIVYGFDYPRSRTDVLKRFTDEPGLMLLFAGEFRRILPLWANRGRQGEQAGRIADAAACWTNVARCHNALGALAEAQAALDRATPLAARLTGQSALNVAILAAKFEMAVAEDAGWKSIRFTSESSGEHSWALATIQAGGTRIFAHLGRAAEAGTLLEAFLEPFRHARDRRIIAWNAFGDVAAALWLLGRADDTGILERKLREQVLEPDFRYPMQDVRLSMGYLCALRGRCDEAVEWFTHARAVLDEQGARPLRAIVDYDEALMYVRRGDPGDGARALPLLQVAAEQFRAIGMTGWIKRAEELRAQLGAPPSVSPSAAGPAAEPVTSSPASRALAPEGNLFRREGDYWTIAFDARTIRVKDSKGLGYLAQLLRHAGHELHVFDLVAVGTDAAVQGDPKRARRDGTPLLDDRAKGEYKRRLDELREELGEAEGNSDLGRVAKAREEIESITEQLAAAMGLGGRDRSVSTDAERARLTVTKGIKSAIAKIRASHPGLAHHLANCVKTGSFCSYTPDSLRPIDWQL